MTTEPVERARLRFHRVRRYRTRPRWPGRGAVRRADRSPAARARDVEPRVSRSAHRAGPATDRGSAWGAGGRDAAARGVSDPGSLQGGAKTIDSW